MRSFWLSIPLLLVVCCGDSDAGSSVDAAVDAGGPEPLERCMAAGSEAACTAIELPELEDCADCWHDCLWLPLHEATFDDGTCMFGSSTGICTHRRGGEDGATDLAMTCSDTASSYGSFWIDRSGDTPRVGFASSGSLMHPLIESCRSDGDDYGRVPECRCLCVEGSPEVE
jgi:hypothetical protein